MTNKSLSALDLCMLARALSLAKNGLYTTTPNPRVGCVICKDGRIIAEGWHQHTGSPHAEICALQKINNATQGTDIYISLEPCNHIGQTPPCTDALLAAKPARVIVAMADPNPCVAGGGIRTLRENGIAVSLPPPDTDIAKHAHALNVGFVSRMTRQKPWLRLKIAATADGKTAVKSGLSRWISNDQSRLDTHHLRARSCALLTGIGTALIDNPQLTVRHVQTTRQPLRVLVDSALRAPKNLALFADSNALVATATPPPDGFPVETVVLANNQNKVDLSALLRLLAERGCNEVMVESGRKLNGALLAAGLVDEIVLYLAPRIFGGGKDMFSLPPLATPQAAPSFQLVSVETIGDDIKIVYHRVASA